MMFYPDLVVPTQKNAQNIYWNLDREISQRFNPNNAKYEDLYSSPANIVWLRECLKYDAICAVFGIPDEERVRKVNNLQRTTCVSSRQ